jgi:hypothetical protein
LRVSGITAKRSGAAGNGGGRVRTKCGRVGSAAAFLAFGFRAVLGIPTVDSPSATAIAIYSADLAAGAAAGLASGAASGFAVGLGAETGSSGIMSFLANRIDAACPVGCAVAVAAQAPCLSAPAA